MLFSHLVASLATSALLLVTGAQALTPPEQPTKIEVAVNPVYPVSPDGTLVPWKTLLSRDPELYELSSKCENPWLDPMRKNDGDALITGYPSYSILQFQPGTFLGGVKQYDAYPEAKKMTAPREMPDEYLQKYVDLHPKLTNEDKVILAAIRDPYLQIYVARHMINDGQGGQWTCYNTLNLAEKYPWKKTQKMTVTSELVSKSLD